MQKVEFCRRSPRGNSRSLQNLGGIMKTKYPSMFGILAALMLVASFVVPANFASPSAVQADPGICKWDNLSEPGALYGTYVVGYQNGLDTEPIDIAVGSDTSTFAVIIRLGAYAAPLTFRNILLYSDTRGVFWTGTRYNALAREPGFGGGGPRNLFQVVMAPDNPKFMAVTTDNGTIGTGPRELWITENGGSAWDVTNLNTFLAATV